MPWYDPYDEFTRRRGNPTIDERPGPPPRLLDAEAVTTLQPGTPAPRRWWDAIRRRL
ncbi:hypothetical protein ACFVMC_00410 [Nocardia sp. NPDC127579]|uniref:hypothetical protein n=1 Tax=Nocardia sp. NPDC127579 TaxID=3345402 RepID=UPI0036336E2E